MMHSKRHNNRLIGVALFIIIAVLFSACGSNTLREAQNAFDAGEYENAIRIINDSGENIADNEDLNNLYVSCYEKWGEELVSAGEYQKTIEVLNDSGIAMNDASNVASIYKDALNKLIDQKIAEKNYSEAYDLLSKVLESNSASSEDTKELFYRIGDGFSGVKKYAAAGLAYAHAGDYNDASKKSNAMWDKGAYRNTACIEDYTAVGIKEDGTVESAINTELIDGLTNVSAKMNRARTTINTDGWTDMVSVLCNDYYYVGLDSNGKVKVGETGCTVLIPEGKLSTPDWSDIVSIDLSDGTLVGVDKYGRVHVAGDKASDFSGVESWTNIVQVSVNYKKLTGVDVLGSVHVINASVNSDNYDADDTYDNPFEEKELQGVNASQFIANSYYGVYVTKAGELKTTVTAERAEKTQFDTVFGTKEQMELKDYSGFENGDFVSCDASYDHYMGLRKDGTVRAGGYMGTIFENNLGVKDLTDLQEAHLGIGSNPVVYGVTSDGTFKMAGYEGGDYIPYHDRIKAWGQLKAPTIEYDTSEFK